MKKYLKSILISLGIILILTIIVSLFNYFGILSGGIFKIIKLLIPIIAIIYSGYKIGTISDKKGYLEGLKFGLLFIIIILIINLILKNNIKINNIIYFLILSLSSVFSSMIGINKKKND